MMNREDRVTMERDGRAKMNIGKQAGVAGGVNEEVREVRGEDDSKERPKSTENQPVQMSLSQKTLSTIQSTKWQPSKTIVTES